MLLWSDGFDHYGDAAGMSNGSYANVENVELTTDPTLVRTGDYAINLTGGDNAQRSFLRLLDTASNTAGIFLAVLALDSVGANDRFFWAIRDSAGNVQCSISFNASLGITAWRGAPGGTNLGSSDPGVVQLGAYGMIEAKFVVDPAAGSIEVRIQGVTVLLVSGANTAAQGTTDVGQALVIKTGGVSSTWPTWWGDDFGIWDGEGTRNNDFFSTPDQDLRCRTRFTTANGGSQDWVNHGGASAWESLATLPPVPLTDFISAANAGDISSFVMTPIPTNSSTVFGVNLIGLIYKTDVGGCTVALGIDSDGHVAEGDTISPGTGASYYNAIFEVDPDGGGNLTYAKINAMLGQGDRIA